jgi:hypothetical protein
MTHILKSWPQFFEPLLAGDVSYDPRRNDRNYRPDSSSSV